MKQARLKLVIRLAAAVLTLCASIQVSFAAGFISATKVSKVGDLASVAITFNCNVSYLDHDPMQNGDQLHIQLEPNSICRGASPQAALTREQLRPIASDDIGLIDIEYDGTSPGGTMLRLNFSDDVGFGLEPFTNANTIIVRVYLNQSSLQTTTVATRPDRVSRQVQQVEQAKSRYVINLQSSLRPPATADLPDINIGADRELFVAEAVIDGTTWYRIRLGYFPTAELAARELSRLRTDFPSAWIDRAGEESSMTAVATRDMIPMPKQPGTDAESIEIEGESASLMRDARRAMTAGELSRAIQIYTKILQRSDGSVHPEAQEFLALARERNGQIAHAKAEYQRYLANYPDSEGASRVSQRLAALLSQGGARPATPARVARDMPGRRRVPGPWTVRAFFTQFYRRDVNQVNDGDEIVSQSALYSDVNFDARRRGERYDFAARISGGYRHDFLGELEGSGNDFRLSYAYADLADSRLGLRSRLGRQSKNTGGVLGRFDGASFSYQATERVRLEAVAGKPVNSVSDGVDDSRTFYGVSSNFGPIADDLDFGLFFLQQDVEDITDRQAVGAEMRYFSENKSLWAMVDYDTSFDELGSVFVQGSLRLPSQMTLTGVVDQRRSPFLSASNAVIGQTVTEFDELLTLFTEEEIRQLALDRAASSTSVTLGLSRPLTPKLQLNVNASESRIDATPDSGGVTGIPESTYRYVSTDLIASSLLREGDVSIIGLRFADSDTNETYSINLDTRFPLGRTFRFNPRLRVNYREIKTDGSVELTYIPGFRLQYRKDRKFRIDFEVGMQFSSREMSTVDQDRESWFVNLGYQFFY